jgi:uncharacterized protein (TIGR02678 family)
VSPVRAVQRPGPAEDIRATAERRTAARALLLHPLLLADGPHDEEFRLVRRHREELERLFAEGLGYRLLVQPRAARLFKAGLGRDATRPLRRRSGAPVSPRVYALLCLVLAALTRCKSQLLVDELVAEVRSAVADAGLDIDLDTATDRRALHAALLALVERGVLSERDGDLARWGEDARVLSLLDVHRERLRLLPAASLAGADSPDQLLDAAALPSAAGGARVAVRRRLLESPLLSTAELPAEQAEWWSRNRNRERDWFRDRFGLELELRAEGALVLDPAEELTDTPFPGQGSARHAALLLLDELVAAARPAALEADPAERTWWPVPADAVEAGCARVLSSYGKGFKKAHRDDPEALRADAVGVLRDVGLVRDDLTGGLLVHAAAARYAPRPTLAAKAGSGERSLFDGED